MHNANESCVVLSIVHLYQHYVVIYALFSLNWPHWATVSPVCGIFWYIFQILVQCEKMYEEYTAQYSTVQYSAVL